MSGELHINSMFGDPLKGDVKLADTENNPFYGYYGYCRSRGAIKHSGFDYITKEPSEEGKGDTILAVGNGEIVRIRIGHPTGNCGQIKRIKINAFTAKICIKCPYQSNCYGIHVWLKLNTTNNYYALYAHLSELSENIINRIKINMNTTDILPPMEIKKGDVIGKSGRTGIAAEKDKDAKRNLYNGFKWPAHLHFECRKSNGNDIPERNTQIIPNHIVKTVFKVIKKPIDIISFYYSIWDPYDNNVSQNDWKKFLKEFYNGIAHGYNPYEIFGDDINTRNRVLLY